jgi:hypothetical protein
MEGLTSYKYLLRGTGQLARNYQGLGAKPLKRKPLRTD